MCTASKQNSSDLHSTAMDVDSPLTDKQKRAIDKEKRAAAKKATDAKGWSSTMQPKKSTYSDDMARAIQNSLRDMNRSRKE
jgi:hypothetical protein